MFSFNFFSILLGHHNCSSIKKILFYFFWLILFYCFRLLYKTFGFFLFLFDFLFFQVFKLLINFFFFFNYLELLSPSFLSFFFSGFILLTPIPIAFFNFMSITFPYIFYFLFFLTPFLLLFPTRLSIFYKIRIHLKKIFSTIKINCSVAFFAEIKRNHGKTGVK